jgi:hypothetical protein
MSRNYLIKINKILINKRGTKLNKTKVMKSIEKDIERKRKKRQKRRMKSLTRHQERLMERHTFERKTIQKLFPDAKMVSLNIASVPEPLKLRFFGWCTNRSYTMQGRIRKFMYECVTGVIKE